MHREFRPEQFACTTGDIGTMASLAAAGMGIAFLPGDQSDPDLVEFFALQPAVSTELWIVVRPDQQRAARTSIFAQFLKKALREHPSLKRFLK
jgi:DNA-binding transcriptional LysR family regulator